ncbi:hypothetical protein [Cellulomonas sp. URHB0016]
MRRTLRVGATLVVVVVTAACGSDGPGTAAAATSASQPPTVDPSAARQNDVDDATAALLAFNAADNQVGTGGYADRSPLDRYLSGDLRPAVISEYESYAASGVHQVGDVTIPTTALVEYQDSVPGHEVVVLDACVDTSQADFLAADGSSIAAPDQHARHLVTYRMVHEDDGRWTVAGLDPGGGRSC